MKLLIRQSNMPWQMKTVHLSHSPSLPQCLPRHSLLHYILSHSLALILTHTSLTPYLHTVLDFVEMYKEIDMEDLLSLRIIKITPRVVHK